VSVLKAISASIVQGSAAGPGSPGGKWHIFAEPGNVSVSFFLDGFG